MEPEPSRPNAHSKWLDATLARLIAHLLVEHVHVRFRVLGATALAFENVRDERLRTHPAFSLARTLFTELAETLRRHVAREERLVFPLVESMEDAWTQASAAPPRLERGLSPVVAGLVAEHAQIENKLRELGKCRVAFQCSEHAHCMELARHVQELEVRLHEYIDLENTVLFPRALALEENLYAVPS